MEINIKYEIFVSMNNKANLSYLYPERKIMTDSP